MLSSLFATIDALVAYSYRHRETRSPSAQIFHTNRYESVKLRTAKATPAGNILYSVRESLIAADNLWGLYAVVATSAAVGLKLEKTRIGRSLSGPVCAMLITATLTNVGVMPVEGSLYLSVLQSFVVKLATPLLLLSADLSKILEETGVLLKAFLVGALGTMLGSGLGYFLFANSMSTVGLQGDSWKVASALTAKNIGGGLNFMAVADIFNISPVGITTGLAVDNILGLLYFPTLSWLGNTEYCQQEATKGLERQQNEKKKAENEIGDNKDGEELENYLTVLALGLTVAALAELLQQSTNFPAIAASTFMAVLIASSAPKKLASITKPGELIGKLFLLLFFGSIGNSSGSIFSTLQSSGALSFFGFGTILYTVHMIVLFVVGSKILKIPMPDLLVASNANIGNAATASAFTTAMGWKSRLEPAILVGNLGNFLGTFLGVWIGKNIFSKYLF